jgi:hypothetical protein
MGHPAYSFRYSVVPIAVEPGYNDTGFSDTSYIASHVFGTTQFLTVNPLKTKRICFIYGLSAYRAVNTLHFGYKNQSLNVL